MKIIPELEITSDNPPEPFIGPIEQLNQMVLLMNDLHSANIDEITINLTNFDLKFKLDNDNYYKDEFLYDELKKYFNNIVKKKIREGIVGNYILTHLSKQK